MHATSGMRPARYKGPVKAVVLDWAGTAVDFGCMGPVASFIQAFAAHGVGVSVEEARAPMGKEKKEHVRLMLRMPSVAGKWLRTHGHMPDETSLEAIYAAVEGHMVQAIAAHATPVPGLIPFITAVRAAGIRVGSCTGYTAPMVAQLAPAAARLGYAPDVVVCSSDVPAGRPHPWMCFQNAIQLGIFPMETMVKIGDTVPDIQEGLNAGMWTIGVTDTSSMMGLTQDEFVSLSVQERNVRRGIVARQLQEAGAHYLAESVADCFPVVEEINGRLANGESPMYAIADAHAQRSKL